MPEFSIIKNCPGTRLSTTSDPTAADLALSMRDTCDSLRKRAAEIKDMAGENSALTAAAEEIDKTATWVCELADLISCLPPAQVIKCPEKTA